MGVITTIKVGDLMGAGRNHFGLCGQPRHPFQKADRREVRVKALSQWVTKVVLVTHNKAMLWSHLPQKRPLVVLWRGAGKKNVASRCLSGRATVLLLLKLDDSRLVR